MLDQIGSCVGVVFKYLKVEEVVLLKFLNKSFGNLVSNYAGVVLRLKQDRLEKFSKVKNLCLLVLHSNKPLQLDLSTYVLSKNQVTTLLKSIPLNSELKLLIEESTFVSLGNLTLKITSMKLLLDQEYIECGKLLSYTLTNGNLKSVAIYVRSNRWYDENTWEEFLSFLRKALVNSSVECLEMPPFLDLEKVKSQYFPISFLEEEPSFIVCKCIEAIKLSNVTYLDLSNNRLPKESIEVLLECNLVSLKLVNCYLGNQVTCILEKLKHSNLQKLFLGHNTLTKHSAEMLCEVLPNSNLTTISLRRTRINWGNSLFESLSLSRVKSIDLSLNSVQIRGVSEFSLLKIRCLNLSNNALDSEAARTIGHLLGNSSLVSLDLSQNQIEDLTSICKNLNELQCLDLSQNFMSDFCAESLAQALPSSKLTELFLEFNEFTDKGAELLLNSACKLKSLDLGHNKLTSKSTKALASAIPKTQIAYLSLRGNELNEEVLKGFLSSLPFSRIRALKVNLARQKTYVVSQLKQLCYQLEIDLPFNH